MAFTSLSVHSSTAAVPHALASRRRQRPGRCFATTETVERTTASKAETESSAQNKVYLGKGRFVEDDPKKYPGRDNELTGGWAGGEVGLKAFVVDADATAAAKAAKEAPKPGKPIAGGNDTIYLGKGRMIKDDAKKYPGRDNSLTGGFAGGERGLKAFVATGDVPIAQDGRGRRQQSPLIIAGVVAVTATAGGLLLSSLQEAGDEAIVSQLGSGLTAVGAAASTAKVVAMDDNTRLLLEAAVVLVGLAGTLVGGRALVVGLAGQLKDTLSRLATLSVFWLVVFAVAKLVLDS